MWKKIPAWHSFHGNVLMVVQSILFFHTISVPTGIFFFFMVHIRKHAVLFVVLMQLSKYTTKSSITLDPPPLL